jgi:hypothetical protein
MQSNCIIAASFCSRRTDRTARLEKMMIGREKVDEPGVGSRWLYN